MPPSKSMKEIFEVGLLILDDTGKERSEAETVNNDRKSDENKNALGFTH